MESAAPIISLVASVISVSVAVVSVSAIFTRWLRGDIQDLRHQLRNQDDRQTSDIRELRQDVKAILLRLPPRPE